MSKVIYPADYQMEHWGGKVILDYAKLTWRDMADITLAIQTEMKRRNPIGINCYAPVVGEAARLLCEISNAEAINFTSECGPKEPKRKKK